VRSAPLGVVEKQAVEPLVLAEMFPVALFWVAVNVPPRATPPAPETESVNGFGDVVTLTTPGAGVGVGGDVGGGLLLLLLLPPHAVKPASARAATATSFAARVGVTKVFTMLLLESYARKATFKSTPLYHRALGWACVHRRLFTNG
jgi:hypothetical protein